MPALGNSTACWFGSWTGSGAPWWTASTASAPSKTWVRFIAVTQNLDTDIKNPASGFVLHVLAAAAEFERALSREWTQAGRLPYKQDYEAGRVGNGVYSRSGRNLLPHGWAGCSNTIAAPHEYFDHTGSGNFRPRYYLPRT